MTNKTISINPQLFSMGGAKTKKNREKKEKVNVIPLISPNVLKNKLLKRIKEHKQRETENLDNNKRKLSNNIDSNSISNNAIEESSQDYTDEFSESINYLQTLSKQKKVDEEKANYERKKEQKLKQLQTQTIKNYASLQQGGSSVINIDLPEELQMVMPQTTNAIPITINPPRNDFIPYSNLKGGSKPSYRDWNKTQRSSVVTNPNLASAIKSGKEGLTDYLKQQFIKDPTNFQSNIKTQMDSFKTQFKTLIDSVHITPGIILSGGNRRISRSKKNINSVILSRKNDKKKTMKYKAKINKHTRNMFRGIRN